jgi:hypothetical protein
MRFRHFAPLILVSLAAAAAPAPLREYLEYPSSVEPSLRLFARFECAAPTGVMLVSMHGWHGGVKRPTNDTVADPLAKHYFVISPEMRGRGDATGQPDCNGWELQDVVDAVEFARRRLPRPHRVAGSRVPLRRQRRRWQCVRAARQVPRHLRRRPRVLRHQRFCAVARVRSQGRVSR